MIVLNRWKGLATVLGCVCALLNMQSCSKSYKENSVVPEAEIQTKSDNDKPNIIFFLVDDLGYSDIGAYNETSFYETPNIDDLSKQGVTFTDGYAANPVCSPSRMAVMTGLHPTKQKATDWFHAKGGHHRSENFNPADLNEYLALEETTLPERLKRQGYHTSFVGKWHLGEEEKYWPENQGFDVNIAGIDRGQPPNGYFSPYKNPRLSDGPEGEYLTDRLTAETQKLVETGAASNKPFFIYLSYYTVHTPLQAPEDNIAKYETKKAALGDTQDFTEIEQIWPVEEKRFARSTQNHTTYASMVEKLDESVGKILQTLEKTGQADNTIIVFTSDNGGLSTSEGSPTSNLPLKGGKGWLYEGGIRVPYIVKFPNSTHSGKKFDAPVISMDLHATLLDIAGEEQDVIDALDGENLLPLINGKAGESEKFHQRPLIFHYPHYSNQGGFPGAAIRIGPWKYIERFEDGSSHLYNVVTDLSETTDLKSENLVQTQLLRKTLHTWYADTDAEFLKPKNGRTPWVPTLSEEE